jgi:hypothetical protein
VTVRLVIGGLLKGEIYITRREIYRNYLALHPDGRWIGHVEDLSEQFVIDASMKILKQESNNLQIPDPGLNPLVLVRVPDSVTRLEGPGADKGYALSAGARLRRCRGKAFCEETLMLAP